MKKILIAVCMLLLTLTSLSGCSSNYKTVAVTTYPVKYLIDTISGGKIKTVDISENVAIQTASIKSNYKYLISNCDALFYFNDLEPYMEIYADDFESSRIEKIDLSSASAYYAFKRNEYVDSDGVESLQITDYYDNSIFDNVDVYKNDPNMWIDPNGMLSCAETVKKYLVNAYPQYESTFTSNYKSLKLKLAKLDAEYQTLNDSSSNIAIVTITPSFGNLQRPYGVKVYPLCLSKYGALPDSQQLEVIEQAIRSNGVKYIANEKNVDSDMRDLYARVKSDLGLQSVKLSNMSSLSKEELKDNTDYLTMMYENLSTLESIGN